MVGIFIYGLFLHTHKIVSIINDGFKNVGHNMISVEFVSTRATNEFIKNPILEMCKYKSIKPIYTISRMGLIKCISVLVCGETGFVSGTYPWLLTA